MRLPKSRQVPQQSIKWPQPAPLSLLLFINGAVVIAVPFALRVDPGGRGTEAGGLGFHTTAELWSRLELLIDLRSSWQRGLRRRL